MPLVAVEVKLVPLVACHLLLIHLSWKSLKSWKSRKISVQSWKSLKISFQSWKSLKSWKGCSQSRRCLRQRRWRLPQVGQTVEDGGLDV